MQDFSYGETETVTASGDVAARRAVGFDGAQATVAGQKVLGFARFAAKDKETLTVDARGTVKAISGAAIANGASVMTDAQGRVVSAPALAVAAGGTAVTSAAANGAAALAGGDPPAFVIGDARSVATAADQEVVILLRR